MGKTSISITDGYRSIIFYSFNAFQDLELTNEHNFNILEGNMKTRKIGNVWRVVFTDCGGNVQTAEHKSLQMALAMAFINRTTVLGG